MATIQTVTTQGATLQIFGSLTVAELTSTRNTFGQAAVLRSWANTKQRLI